MDKDHLSKEEARKLHMKEYKKVYSVLNKEKIKEASARYRRENDDKIRHGVYLRAFGISIEEYYRKLEDQNGTCAICKQPETKKHSNGTVYRLAVDHDHTTNVVRGLLCTKCNMALGLFADSAILLNRASEYLKEYEDNCNVPSL